MAETDAACRRPVGPSSTGIGSGGSATTSAGSHPGSIVMARTPTPLARPAAPPSAPRTHLDPYLDALSRRRVARTACGGRAVSTTRLAPDGTRRASQVRSPDRVPEPSGLSRASRSVARPSWARPERGGRNAIRWAVPENPAAARPTAAPTVEQAAGQRGRRHAQRLEGVVVPGHFPRGALHGLDVQDQDHLATASRLPPPADRLAQARRRSPMDATQRIAGLERSHPAEQGRVVDEALARASLPDRRPVHACVMDADRARCHRQLGGEGSAPRSPRGVPPGRGRGDGSVPARTPLAAAPRRGSGG